MAESGPISQSPRLKAMLIPREHGAWGMLLVPLVTGAVVAAGSGANYAALLCFLVLALSLFWLRTPAEAWLGTSAIKAQSSAERSAVVRLSLSLALVAGSALAALVSMARIRGLLLIGCLAAAAFGVQLCVKSLGRAGRMPAQIIGAIGLTSTAAGAFYVSTGRFDRLAVTLWIANWLFAAGQVHFVQVRIRGSRLATFSEKLRHSYGFLLGQSALAVAVPLASYSRFLPRYTLVAFAPSLVRGFLWYGRGLTPLDVHKLGFSELRQALLFGTLLCVVFLL